MVLLIRTFRRLPQLNQTKRILQNIQQFSTQLNQQQTQETKEDPTAKKVKPTLKKIDTTAVTGGVWAQTSSKREKITELKAELTKDQNTLDDVAIEKEKLDLNLIDGLNLVARAVDESWDMTNNNTSNTSNNRKSVDLFNKWLVDTSTIFTTMEEKKQGLNKEMLDEKAFLSHLTAGNNILSSFIKPDTHISSFPSLLDFVEVDDDLTSSITNNNKIKSTEEAFEKCVIFYRLCLTKAAIDLLSNNWSTLLEITSGDLDRAAVAHLPTPTISTLPISKVNAIIQSYVSGSCTDQLAAWWDLYDKDNDSRLDQIEMENVVNSLLQPYQNAFQYMLPTILESFHNPNVSWRQRRQQTNHFKKLGKVFKKATANHFDLEVETPHRLRCVYAWAEKSHQNNKIDSVLVDESDLGGKKRYVELEPKISLEEFRIVQTEHFNHVDRVGQEILSSFREDVWVLQGGRRQNLQLKREVLFFFTVVTIADFGILAL